MESDDDLPALHTLLGDGGRAGAAGRTTDEAIDLTLSDGEPPPPVAAKRLRAAAAAAAPPPSSDADDADAPLASHLAARAGAPRENRPRAAAAAAPRDDDVVCLEDSDDDAGARAAKPPAPAPRPPSPEDSSGDSGMSLGGAGSSPPRRAAAAAAAEARPAKDAPPPPPAGKGAARAAAAASAKAAKCAGAAAKAAAKACARAASGKVWRRQLTAVVDARLASTKAGLALGAAFHREKLVHVVSSLPVACSVVWVRHPPLPDATPWAGALPFGPTAAAASREGATAVPYILLVVAPEALAEGVESHGSLSHLVDSARSHHRGATLCVAVFGLDGWLRAKEQREFNAGGGGFRRAPVDESLIRLLTHHRGVRFRECADVDEIAEHGVLLTEALGKAPFREEESFLVLFGENSKTKGIKHRKPAGGGAGPAAAQGGEGSDGGGGGEEDGDDPDGAAAAAAPPRDASLAAAWLSALASIPACSAEASAAIAGVYPGPSSLLAAYAGLAPAAAQALLQNLSLSSTTAGGKARRVGPACSARVWAIFVGKGGLEYA